MGTSGSNLMHIMETNKQKLDQSVLFYFFSFPSSLDVAHIRIHLNMRTWSLNIEIFKVNLASWWLLKLRSI